MKVIHYERMWRNPINLDNNSFGHCFYIPEEGVLLYQTKTGSNVHFRYGIYQQFLNEAEQIAEGNIPKEEGLTISNVKEFETSSSNLNKLINQIGRRDSLEDQIKTEFDELFSKMRDLVKNLEY